MKRFLVCGKAFVLMLLAAALLFATGMTAHAQDIGEVYVGSVTNPTSLNQDTITVLQTPTPFDPGNSGSEDPYVGPTTDGEMYLSYMGEDGNNYHPIYPISIDNTTQAMTVTINGSSYPVSSLADVFSVLPEPPAPVPANFGAAFDQPVALAFGGGAQVALKGPFYVTDQLNPKTNKPVKVYTQPWGGAPGVRNYTQAEALALIYLDPKNLKGKVKVVTQLIGGIQVPVLPTWSYDCHGFTFTSTDDYGTGAQWMTGDQVQYKILNPVVGNGYNEIAANQVQAGDIVVYWGADGNVAHSGRVIDVTAGVITVRSKWGPFGLYDHLPNDVLTIYGQPKFYHTNRGSNVLKTVP